MSDVFAMHVRDAFQDLPDEGGGFSLGQILSFADVIE